jgi:hypothetical protein
LAQPLLRTLGVLRRPQTKADLDPALLRILERPGSLLSGLGTPDVPLIGLATVTPWGSKVFLVPRKPLTAQQVAELPPQLRTFAFRRLDRQRNQETLQEMELRGLAGGGGCCATAADIQSFGDGSWGGESGSPATHAVLVVPDGVSKVSLLFPRHAPGGRTYKTSLVVTAPVHNNVLAIAINRGVDDPFQSMIWYGPTGQVIKRAS